MSMDEGQVCRLVDADDLWGCRTHHAISESLPTPLVVVQGVNGTALQDIDGPIQEGNQRQMDMPPTRLASRLMPDSRGDAPHGWRVKPVRHCERRRAYRFPDLHAVAKGLRPYLLASLSRDDAPGGKGSCDGKEFSPSLAYLSSLTLEAGSPESQITEVTA